MFGFKKERRNADIIVEHLLEEKEKAAAALYSLILAVNDQKAGVAPMEVRVQMMEALYLKFRRKEFDLSKELPALSAACLYYWAVGDYVLPEDRSLMISIIKQFADRLSLSSETDTKLYKFFFNTFTEVATNMSHE